MLKHVFVHEDVLIKKFKFSLEGYAREWCQSLPTAIIHSLKVFHMVFNSHFEKIYPVEIIFKEWSEKYKIYIQNEVEYSSRDELCEDIDERESKDEIVSSNENMNEPFSLFIFQEESLPDMIHDCAYDCMVDALYSSPSTHIVSYLKEEIVLEEDPSLFLQEISHEMFSPRIEMKNQEIAPVLQDGGFLRSLGFDEYSDEEKQILASHSVYLGRIQPTYEIFESYSKLDMQDFP
jgi:hypothetical protein